MDIPSFADLNLGVTLPAVFLALGTTVLLLIDAFLPKERRHLTAWFALAGVLVSFVLTLFNFGSSETALAGMFVADSFTGFMNLVALTAAAITILLSIDYLKRTGNARGEFYSLLLLSTAGAMFMASANDLIVVFVALELLSIPLYIMAAFRLNNAKSEESGMKYFILGAFSSAFLVYGSALIYGATGTTNLQEILASIGGIVEAGSSAIFYLVIGAALIVVGLGFKVAVVPFHMWTPDVYEGAPTPVTAFMSVGAKIGGFAALLRVLVTALPFLVAGQTVEPVWQNTIMIVAALTLIVGNFVAISQSNIKRMLAYSSIAHAGYIMMAVAAAANPFTADFAARSALIYLLAYTFTNLGAFAIALAIEKDDGSGTDIKDFVGLARSKPVLAAAMAVFMFSLTGIPLTAGFTGKWFVFQATMQAGLVPLAVIGVLTSVVSAFYYVRIIVNMYLSDGEGDEAAGATPLVNWAVYISFAGTLLLGVFPILATNLTETVTLLASVAP
ncbi:MAG: NADH-quinone oxidoreductase subunit N [Chloroflexi bacterium OLB13]|nr:MAG: NADH-quinone oxidoreductase subunit N [Chloroflexi bacterium OLB13]